MEQLNPQVPKTANADRRRAVARYPTDAAVACRRFSSKWCAYSVDAVMRNFSRTGAYIEAAHDFKIGTILQLRLAQYPAPLGSIDPDDQPRSICLAAVKWRQTLAAEESNQYGYGLKHLD
jgi:hypothetical protein